MLINTLIIAVLHPPAVNKGLISIENCLFYYCSGHPEALRNVLVNHFSAHHRSPLKTGDNLWCIRGDFCHWEPLICVLMFPLFCQRVGGVHFKQLDSQRVLNLWTNNESEPLWQFTWGLINVVISLKSYYPNSNICKYYHLNENQNTCCVGGLWIQIVLHFETSKSNA